MTSADIPTEAEWRIPDQWMQVVEHALAAVPQLHDAEDFGVAAWDILSALAPLIAERVRDAERAAKIEALNEAINQMTDDGEKFMWPISTLRDLRAEVRDA